MLMLICDAFDASLPGKLKQLGEVTDDVGRLKDANVVMVRSKTKVTREFIDAAPNLKLIIRGGVGTDNIDSAYAKSKGIFVRNTPKASSVAVAELAVCLMLAIPNFLVQAHNGMKEGKFLKKEIKRTELFQKTLGIIGIGAIGTEVARRAAAFGMKVVAFDPMVKTHAVADMLPTMEEVFKVADYVSFHTPLTDQTRGMINKDMIAKMKDGVVLVNTGRGKIIVEADLADALTSGKVRAYGTDVWYSDPPDPSCPLLAAPNVLMTPHLGANSKENLLRIGVEVVDMLTAYRKEGIL